MHVPLKIFAIRDLQGSSLHKRSAWSNFSTTIFDDGGNSDRNYLVPSLRFTCNGMLQELPFPVELRGSASTHWNNRINIGITVCRPVGRTGYDEIYIAAITSTLVTTETESMIALARTEVLQFSMTIVTATQIQTNDIIALTYEGLEKQGMV